MRPVFIGGTGRSGTTVLGRVLSYHKDIFTIPFETRFIVDIYGLEDVVNALSQNLDVYRAHHTIENFIFLMKDLYPPKPVHVVRGGLKILLPKIGISPPRFSITVNKLWKNEKYFNVFNPAFSMFHTRHEYLKILNSFFTGNYFFRV